MVPRAGAHTLNPNTQEEAEAGRSLVAQAQPGLHTSSRTVRTIERQTLSQKKNSTFKIQYLCRVIINQIERQD